MTATDRKTVREMLRSVRSAASTVESGPLRATLWAFSRNVQNWVDRQPERPETT